jgi:hypothetical protein
MPLRVFCYVKQQPTNGALEIGAPHTSRLDG